METSHNTTKLAQHNKISPMHCGDFVVEISLYCALLRHRSFHRHMILQKSF